MGGAAADSHPGSRRRPRAVRINPLHVLNASSWSTHDTAFSARSAAVGGAVATAAPEANTAREQCRLNRCQKIYFA